MIEMATEERIQSPGVSHPSEGDFSPLEESSWKKARYSLGAHISGQSATFAVYSGHATQVLLEVYGNRIGEPARFDYWMARGSDGVWRAKLSGVPKGALYAFRCWGPNWPLSPEWRRGNNAAGFLSDVDGAGNRFNPNKVLFDPYARELSHDRETPDIKEVHGHNAAMYGTGPGTYQGMSDRHPPVVRREFDTGPWAPKGIVVRDSASTGTKPRIPQKDAAIYEAHVRGLTRHPSSSRLRAILTDIPGFEAVEDIPPELRGTYAGAGRMAGYLKALGYTAIELLPVHEFANDLNPEGSPGWDREVDEPPHGNYWGYMTYGFFAPDTRYAHDRSPGGPTREFKHMVKEFHDQGIEVYLDVVYNHTGEGGLWDAIGDTAELLSFRGLDNAGYYALAAGNRHYWDSSGCGNNLDASKVAVSNLIKDSLKYWSGTMGVDGFRFDLATVLGRTGQGFAFQGGGKLLEEIATMAGKEGIEVIAEAWDIGGYHVGDFPKGWAEWNGEYRDEIRRFLKGDGNAPGFAAAVNGDYARFHDQGGPHKSVNFITAHDGFTLMDLVSYNNKNNEVLWPFGPSDGGADNNQSWDSGGSQALRRQRLRNFLAIQYFSRGVPMTLGGDEFGRTQNGNNNPYKIDSIGIWQNYDMIATSSPNAVSTGGSGAYHDNYGRDGHASGRNGLFAFTRFLIGLRRKHPSLRQDKFADLALDSGKDVTYWFKRPDGVSDVRDGDRALHWRIDGSAIGGDDFLIGLNLGPGQVEFALPPPRGGRLWRRIADTAAWAEGVGNFWAPGAQEAMGAPYRVHPYSLVIFQELP